MAAAVRIDRDAVLVLEASTARALLSGGGARDIGKDTIILTVPDGATFEQCQAMAQEAARIRAAGDAT